MSYSNFGKSPKVKRNKLEIDVERYRAECRWSKARDTLNLLKVDKQTPSIVILNNLVQAECKLEKNLNEKDTITAEEILDIKSQLDPVISGTDENYKLEAKILLCKLRYQQGKYKEVIASLEALNLKNTKIEQGSSRLAKLVAEGFAMVGLSMEKLETNGDVKIKKDVLDTIIDNLNLAGDVGLFHLQELEKAVRQNPTSAAETQDEMENSAVVTKLLSKAIQRSPIVSIRHNNIQNAINRYRELLRYCETEMTKPLRQTLARQLAEVLLRGVCLTNYSVIQIDSNETTATGTRGTNPSTTSASSVGTLTPNPVAMWRVPAKYPANNCFKPTTLHQEVVLLLLISEYLANQEAVLNRSQEHTEARLSTLYNSQAVYDLLAISLTRLNCLPQLCQLLQHSLRFSYKEYHSWYQLGLALVSARHFLEAYLVLQECHRIDNTQADAVHLAAALAIEVLGKLSEGLALANRAVQMYKDLDLLCMVARSRLLMARAISLQSQNCKIHEEKQKLQFKAISLFKQATQDDPEDWLAFYLLALEQAFSRQLRPAMESCCYAVKLSGAGTSGSEIASAPLHLLVLLHSAAGSLTEAASVAEAALLDYPTDLGLLQTLARLQLSLHGSKMALYAYRRVVETSRDLETVTMAASRIITVPPNNNASAGGGGGGNNDDTNSHNSFINLNLQHHGYEAMLGLAQLYLDSKLPLEAARCLDTVAASCSTVDHNLLFLRARSHHLMDKLQDAQTMYESCLALCPTNIAAIQNLGSLLQQKKQYQLAEKTLRDAIGLDPNDSCSWQLLGELFTELGTRYTGMGYEHKFKNGAGSRGSVSESLDSSGDLDTINSGKNSGKHQSFDISFDMTFDMDDNGLGSGFLDPPKAEQILSNKFMINQLGFEEIINYSIKCLTVASDLQLTDPIRSFHVLPRAVKQF